MHIDIAKYFNNDRITPNWGHRHVMLEGENG